MKIGVLRGMEQSFPEALIAYINDLRVDDIRAELMAVGGTSMIDPVGYPIIVDRISHDVPFYRAFVKYAALNGSVVINNPFWYGTDDKFFGYALAHRLGLTVPKTVVLPSHDHPPGTTEQSFRNLKYPLDWDAIFAYVGWPAFFKPFSGGGWKDVYKVHSPDEFFQIYERTGTNCMTLQESIEFDQYYRCYCIGKKWVHIMRYDPKQPHHLRYVQNPPPVPEALRARMVADCIKINEALGYDINTAEFAIRDGKPYAIDFTNPVPDCEYQSVTAPNFEWVVKHVAQLLIEKAQNFTATAVDHRWHQFMNA